MRLCSCHGRIRRSGGWLRDVYVTSFTRVQSQSELDQLGVIGVLEKEVVGVVPTVPEAAVLGTDLRDGGRTLGSAGPRWVTVVQDLQRPGSFRATSEQLTVLGRRGYSALG